VDSHQPEHRLKLIKPLAPFCRSGSAYSIGTGTGINGTYSGTVTKGVLGALTTESTYNPTTVAASVAGAGRVAIPYDANLNTQVFTAEVWVKPAVLVGNGGANAVFSSGQPAAGARTGWVLYQFGNGTNNQFSFRAFTKNSNVTTMGDANGLIAGPVLVADTWYHVVIQVDAGGVSRLFVNGTEAGNTSTAAYVAATPANIAGSGQDAGTTIGARYFNGGSSGNPFNGVLDEVAFYSTALSAAEILAHYENGMNSPARTQAYQERVAVSTPVGYYRLDEDPFVAPTAVNSGSLAAAADGAYSVGTLTNQAGPPFAGLGVTNTACGFDGSGQIPCGNDTGFDVTEISVAAWIKASSVNQNMNVIAKGSSLWRLQIDGFTNHLKWVCPGITDGAITGTRNVVDGLWHHVVAVAGTSGSAFYVDGVLDVSDATAVDLSGNVSGDPVTIGSQGASTERWLGSIDEAAVFGTALTETDVVTLYQAVEPPANDIYSFGPGAVITGTDITWTVPMGTDLTTLAPTYTASSFATGSPLSDSIQDFSDSVNNPVPYTITAPDNSSKTYLVTVILGKIPVSTGMVCWYDAGVGVTTSGSKVTNWEDQSGNGHHASGGGGTVTLAASQLAGKPALQFRSSWLNVPGAMFTKEQYLVMKSPTPTWTGGGTMLGPCNSTFNGDGNYRIYDMFAGTWSGSPGSYAGFWTDPPPVAVSRDGTVVAQQSANNFGWPLHPPEIDAQYFILKIDVNTTAKTQVGVPTNYQIGKSADVGTVDFDVVEIIAYDTLLSAADEAKLGSYLAQKYMIASAYPIYYLAVTMTTPTANQEIPYGTSVAVAANVTEPNTSTTDTVKFYTKLLPVGSLDEWPATDSGGGLFTADLGVMASGTYEIYATATNDASPPESANSLTQTFIVAPATGTSTTLDTSGSPSTYGQSVTFTATVLPTPSGGTVQFYDNGSAIGSPATVNTGTGQALVSTTLLGVDGGTAHAITAEYSGYGIYLGSTSDPLPQTVDKAILTVTADNKIRIPGTANPMLTATITGYKNAEDYFTAGVNNDPLLNCEALPGDPEGTYPITCDASPMTAPNYNFTGAGGILTVIAGAVPVSNGLVCWYDAGNGVTADGGTGVVSAWNDLSGNGHHATSGGGSPTLAADQLNAKPAVQFRSSWLNVPGSMFTKEQYLVLKAPGTTWSNNSGFMGPTDPTFTGAGDFRYWRIYNMRTASTAFWPDPAPDAVSKNGTPILPQWGDNFAYPVPPPINEYMILKIDVNTTQYQGSRSPANYQIGRVADTGTIDFDVVEIIGYDHALSGTDDSAVGIYLSNKYGLSTAYVGGGYGTWANANAGGQAANLDYNNDGVANGIAYFMGVTGIATNPGLDGTNTVTWPVSATYNGTYEVQTSADLSNWIAVDPQPEVIGGNLTYALPEGLGKQFIRLLVTPAP